MLKVSLERKRVGLLYPINKKIYNMEEEKDCNIQIPHAIGHIRNASLHW